MNIIELGLSFLEGFALIISPCILPVLPLVLGASVNGGQGRPFGIIFGFIASFTAFALLSRKLVMATGIDTQTITYASLMILALLGIVMLSETLSERFSRFTQRLALVGNHFSRPEKDGFISGIAIGMLIGLVWTPCAGPILAAALVQVIRQESDLSALLLIASFALGAGVPMLIISLTGRSIVTKMGFFARHTHSIRKVFGIIILLAVFFISMGGNVIELFGREDIAILKQEKGLQKGIANPYQAPEIQGITTWLNSTPLKLADLRGKVVLIDFWTYSCINCIRTLPHITKWDRTYRDKGLVIIGVHAPEFEFEKKQINVEAALAKHGIEYPVAMDNRFDTWVAYQNRYWPAHYLINQQGQVVYTHFGEGNYQQTEHNIRYLLELGEKAEFVKETISFSRDQSPETYLGFKRAKHFVSAEKFLVNEVQRYTLPKVIPDNSWALSGEWIVGPEYITAEKGGAALHYRFKAGKVFLVLGSKDSQPIKVTLKLNDQPLKAEAGKDVKNSSLIVKEHTLYELVNQTRVKDGLLEIITQSPGLEAYAFTFGK